MNSWGHELHVDVDDAIRVHVGQLEGFPDLALQALGPGLGDRELDGQGVPRVLRVLVVEVGSHAVGVLVGFVIRAPARVTRPVLRDVTL